MTPLIWLLLALGWLVGSTALLAVRHRRLLRAWWREPVLRRPVLIFESDDWGPADAGHARALERLAEVLARHRDRDGRPAVATLGVVLAVADTARIRAADVTDYFRTGLADCDAVLAALRAGIARGVFTPQLHGLEHYWAPTLLARAWRDPQVKDWLTVEGLPRTEALPPALQSRWIDARQLPSRPLPDPEIAMAAAEEVAAYHMLFGAAPAVVVPPTFVWTPAVERAWARHGVRYIVTPGRRYGGRDAQGRPVAEGGALVNGARGADGVMYLVRDDYFEPARGHTAARALRALETKTRLGRPTLLEMHRDNFVDDPAVADRAYREVDAVLAGALTAQPTLAFVNTETLAEALAARDPAWVEHDRRRRLAAWCERVRSHYPLWRWSRITGLGLAIVLLGMFCARPKGGAA